MDLFLFLALWCRGGPTLFSVGIMIAFKGLVASVRLLRCPEPPPPLYIRCQDSPYPTLHHSAPCLTLAAAREKLGVGVWGLGSRKCLEEDQRRAAVC